MSLSKSLLCITSALALATGAAFAGQDSTVDGSVETSPPELLSEQYSEPMNSSEQLAALEEGDVIYIYPVELTEYYLLIPSESSEMPG